MKRLTIQRTEIDKMIRKRIKGIREINNKLKYIEEARKEWVTDDKGKRRLVRRDLTDDEAGEIASLRKRKEKLPPANVALTLTREAKEILRKGHPNLKGIRVENDRKTGDIIVEVIE